MKSMAQQLRKESNLSDHKRWKPVKSQVTVPAEPQNDNIGDSAEWLKNQTPQEVRISKWYKAGPLS